MKMIRCCFRIGFAHVWKSQVNLYTFQDATAKKTSDWKKKYVPVFSRFEAIVKGVKFLQFDFQNDGHVRQRSGRSSTALRPLSSCKMTLQGLAVTGKSGKKYRTTRNTERSILNLKVGDIA